ncbi:MAG: hypothetical protein VX938_02105 [Myxococcota bacterium]|nr:hypothetical protein [Myxococcota bacterium]
MDAPQKTALYDRHEDHGARMVPFAGFLMPLQYDGILVEHARVREQIGLFDVSHMGEVRVRGGDALDAVNGFITNDIHRIEDGRALKRGQEKRTGEPVTVRPPPRGHGRPPSQIAPL